MKIFFPRTVPFKKSSLHLIRLNVICISFFAVSLLDSGAASIQGAISLKSGSNSLSVGKFFIQLRKLNPETGVFLFLKSAYVGPEKNYTYSFNDLEAGVYSLGCQDLSGEFAVQYYGGASFQEKAKQVKLAGADKVSEVNFQLSEGRALGGQLLDQSGNPVPDMDISILALEEENNLRLYVTGLPTNEKGEWLVGLPAGKYIVLFKDLRDSSTPYAAQWYANALSEESATIVDLNSTTENKNINAVLKQGFALRGRVTDGEGNPLKGIWVNAYIVNPITNKLESVMATATGSKFGQTDPMAVGDYSLILGPGEYIIKFSEDTGDFKTQYWKNASSENEAVRIKIENSDISGVDAFMRIPVWSVTPKSADFIGNLEGGSVRGQVSFRAMISGAFSGWVLTDGGKSPFRGRLDGNRTATVLLRSPAGLLNLSLPSSGLDDGRWDDADLIYFKGSVKIASLEMPVECRPAPIFGGWPAPLPGALLNTLLQSHNESGNNFGHGFASVKPGKDGNFRFAGILADGTKLSASARVVEDGEGGWNLPVAIPLSSVKGFLHGEAVIDDSPVVGGFHMESKEAWTWTRPAKAKAKSFQSGFLEELNVRGREWKWSKGTSALGGNSANFTLDFTFGNSTGGFVPAAGVDGISGSLGESNKPAWSSTPPKGFTMSITPATGLVGGRIPGTQNGRAVSLNYQGMLFSGDVPLESGGSPRGAGFAVGANTSVGFGLDIP